MNKKPRLIKAIVLNDYEGTPYASWVKDGKKKIETRNNRLFKYRGDIVICCGKSNSVGPNAGKALCIVDIWRGRRMIKEDEEAACIEYSEKRKSLLLRNWRHFNRDFDFAKQWVSGPFQGIFTISLPDDIIIIPRPDIVAYADLSPIETNPLKQFQFDFENNYASIDPILTEADHSMIERLKRKVFVFDSSIADEKYFKECLVLYIQSEDSISLRQTCWNMIYERNEQGKYCKYLNFNEHRQKLYLDKLFFEWVKLTCKFITVELQKLERFNN